jgi:imidazolonepropionase-like amidohydrolase
MVKLAALTFAAALLFASAGSRAAGDSQQLAITSVTVIDGTGAEPRRNATVIIADGLIRDIGNARSTGVPPGATVIDGDGLFLLPGFIDSNVHATVYGNSKRRETVVKYGHRNEELALEFLQRQLKHGVTTVRDSYGALEPLKAVRDRIESGEAVGARLLFAGNIVGWGGPFSMTFSLMQESELTLFQATWNDWIAHGVGEEMLDMGPKEAREAINRYLDKGPDFIKYGGTSHFRFPSLIGFSPRIQRIIVDETHKRGLIAETHSTSSEALRISVEAGVDLIQHPEILSRDYPDDLIELIVARGVLCAVRSNTLAGEPWRRHLERKAAAQQAIAAMDPPRTSAERREREEMLGDSYEIERRNAERLIAAGCRVTIATDNYQGDAPEFRKTPKPIEQEAGIGSILAIEGLVELGLSEMEAIVAGTLNGATAAGMVDSIGTVEPGKVADLVLLRADPLDDIGNIRRIEHVVAGGRVVDIARLPEQRLFSRHDTETETNSEISHRRQR